MDYDRVLVLARGVLVESGKPSELAELDPTVSVFASMVQAMGAGEEAAVSPKQAGASH
jgi:ABC-type multidrug transport system fused ATPase/permease subunit